MVACHRYPAWLKVFWQVMRVLDWLVAVDQTLDEACQDLEIYPQTMRNVRIEGPLDSNAPQLLDAIKSAEVDLGEAGRILLRPSGTEPLIRVMVEGQDAAKVENIAAALAEVVEQVSRD